MNIRKSKSSWLFFAIYTITYLYFALCVGYSLSKMLGFGTDIWSCTVVVMVILFSFVGCIAALVMLIDVKSGGDKPNARRIGAQGGSFLVKEVLPAIGSYLLVLISRGIYIGMIPQGQLTGKTVIYDNVVQGGSVVLGQGGVDFLGIEYLYRILLKGFCIFLGNEPVAVYVLNLICQAVLSVGFYLFLRMIAGRAAATAGTLLFLCVPYFYEMLSACEPAQLFMALCAIVMCALAALVKRSVFLPEHKGMAVGYLFLGILTGMLLTLDLSAVVIPVSLIVIYLTTVSGKEGKPAVYLLGIIFGAAASALLFACGMAGERSLVGKGFEYLENYLGLYSVSFSGAEALMLSEDLAFFGIAAFGGIGAVLFFKCEHDLLRIVSVPYFAVALVKLLNISRIDTGFIVFCVVVMAAATAVGMIRCMGRPVEAAAQTAGREKGETADSGEDGDEEDSGQSKIETKKQSKERKKEQARAEKQAREEARQRAKEQARAEKQAREEAQAQAKEQAKAEKQAREEAQAQAKEQAKAEKQAREEEQAKAKEQAKAEKQAEEEARQRAKEQARVEKQAREEAQAQAKEQAKAEKQVSAENQTAAAAQVAASPAVSAQPTSPAGVSIPAESASPAGVNISVESAGPAGVNIPVESASPAGVNIPAESNQPANVSAPEAPAGPKVTLIENPLPLPKKHVHKEMDYGYEVSDEQMHFDSEITADDDFDH